MQRTEELAILVCPPARHARGPHSRSRGSFSAGFTVPTNQASGELLPAWVLQHNGEQICNLEQFNCSAVQQSLQLQCSTGMTVRLYCTTIADSAVQPRPLYSHDSAVLCNCGALYSCSALQLQCSTVYLTVERLGCTADWLYYIDLPLHVFSRVADPVCIVTGLLGRAAGHLLATSL